MARYEPEKVQQVIAAVREVIDPIALMSSIAKKTSMGRKPGPASWHHTHAMFMLFGRPEDADKVISAFALVGVKTETDASTWIAEHMEEIE